MSNTLKTHINDGIAYVTLNRPEKKNAMSLEMMKELVAVGEDIKANPDIRVAIISGAQNCFCSGIDLASLMELAADINAVKSKLLDVEEDMPNDFQAPITIWAELGIPTIAVIEDVCFGAGAQLALGCDFRIAATDARFAIMEAKWGLIPDMGITQSLPRLMRADLALDLIMTGRIINMAEAQGYGLITQLSDTPMDAAIAMADMLKTKSPDALAASKRLIYETWGSSKTALKHEAKLQATLIGGKNQMEMVSAALQKRPAKFS